MLWSEVVLTIITCGLWVCVYILQRPRRAHARLQRFPTRGRADIVSSVASGIRLRCTRAETDSDQRLNPPAPRPVQQSTSSLQCCNCIYSSAAEGMRWLQDRGGETCLLPWVGLGEVQLIFFFF